MAADLLRGIRWPKKKACYRQGDGGVMRESNPKFEKYVFVCVNERPSGERVSCGATFCGKELSEKLKVAVKAAGKSGKVRVSKSKCLDVCEEGANVLIYPDNLWLNHVDLTDIPAILAKLGIQP